ncbi:MAG: hypothetical protein DRQ60_02400 [Gammaproteobacteria bacterium]|nr:MAG: hypothetical protein DRQ60_02400 [Gammaproteobacteria bacterium]
MLHTALTYFRQSRLVSHLPILLGLSLLPLHLAVFTADTRVILLLWGNSLLLATLWYFTTNLRRSTLITALVMFLTICALGFSWSLQTAQTAWLLFLAAIITGRAIAVPHDPLFRLLPAVYLLSLAGFQIFYPDGEMSTDNSLMVSALLNTLGGIAFIACLIPLPEPADRKNTDAAEQTSTALTLTFFVACAALIMSDASSTDNSHIKLAVAIISLLAMITTLLWASKRLTPDKQGYSWEFRQWMTQTLDALSTISNQEEFVRDSMARLATMMQLSGINWQIADVTGELGIIGRQRFSTTSPAGKIASTADQPLSAAFEQQFQLALELLGTLVKFRQQEQQLKTQNHLQSIYETGARITHDVKNLLQSLNTLTTAVEYSKPEQAPALQELIRKQLPLIRQKLQTTLEKLEAPEDVSSTFQVARIWWEKLRMRFEPNQIEFRLQLEMDYLIPRDLFDRVAENLLENAQRKRQSEPDITILIELMVTEQHITLRVTDSGSPAPAEITQLLFKGPVDSTGGYGIALYQCATQAMKQGFQLSLTENEQGRVSFSLNGELT